MIMHFLTPDCYSGTLIFFGGCGVLFIIEVATSLVNLGCYDFHITQVFLAVLSCMRIPKVFYERSCCFLSELV